MRLLSLSLFLLFYFLLSSCDASSQHTNNWAVLVCSSRYWFNYRHMANALGMYRTVKRLGIPDSNIILMLADDAACNSRNKFAGSVYANPGRHLDLYGENIEVDYRGYEVTVENFLRLLTGRLSSSVPRSKRLLTDSSSNIFIYLTGHGGNEFLKFQDNEEVSAHDIADAFHQMYEGGRYNEIFFMVDTCQANSMYSKFYSPGILATGSSVVGENSYSHENDYDIGVAVIDSYTHYVLEYMEKVNKTSRLTMADLFTSYDVPKIGSHPGVRSDLFERPLGPGNPNHPMSEYGRGRGWTVEGGGEWMGREIEAGKNGRVLREALITDFFGGVVDVDVNNEDDAELRLFEDPECISTPKAPLSPLTDTYSSPPSSRSSSSLLNMLDTYPFLRPFLAFILLGALFVLVFSGMTSGRS
ncbi:peptidase C13 family-domain-containing protein [Lentinula guzmanii]|uniref:Peptidase C13 family-domain-containing protein n=1 Tax=Lentinula guzmanii TaxID=2804957 RepID=A0AA38N493_9AGAR|nr:peptidase C13 family-domain-containing protein [Lentinula guzmanii]